MNATQQTIIEVLNLKKYVIPAYQRPYKWGQDQSVQLIDDIYNTFEAKIEEYFVGSLVCILNGKDTYEVIDGQQRLTTLMLVFVVLRDMMENKSCQAIDKIVFNYDLFDTDKRKPRLIVREEDQAVFSSLLNDSEGYYFAKLDTEKRFIENVKSLREYLCKKKINENTEVRKNLIEFIYSNVFIVFITAQNFESAYRLFDVLNSRGMPLLQADVLKNRLFELADKNKQGVSSVETYWKEIESLVEIEHMDKFLTLYETARKKNRHQGIPQYRLAKYFIDLCKSEYNDNAIELIESLKKYAANYKKIVDANFTDEIVNKKINLLHYLQKNKKDCFISKEWYPVILAFLGRIDFIKNFSEFFTLFEKIYFHQWASLEKQKEERVYFCMSIIAKINTCENFSELKNHILDYANNKEVIDYLKSDVHKKGSRKTQLAVYILLNIDQKMQNVCLSSYPKNPVIEHILPYNGSKLAHFSDEEYEQSVCKLGNLTLVALTNKEENFQIKKEKLYKHGMTGVFKLNQDILNYSEWNFKHFQERQELLLEFTKDIWLV